MENIMAKAKTRKVTSTANSSTVCRSVLDTQGVIKDQLANLLATELVSKGTVTKEACRDLISKLSHTIDRQTDSLVDRILNEFTGK